MKTSGSATSDVTPGSRALRRAGVRSLLVVLGATLPLLAFEAFLRCTDALPLHRNPLAGFHTTDRTVGWLGTRSYRARFRRPEFDVTIESDETGFRRPARRVEAPGIPRIAFLGDSFLWGWGVQQGEVLTDRLQERVGQAFDIRNYGVNALGTGQQLLLLEEHVLPAKPEMVIVLFYENDLTDNGDVKGGRRPWFHVEGGCLERENVPVARAVDGWWRDVSHRSLALSTLRYSLNAALDDQKEHDRDAARDEAAQPSHALWELQRALLAEMADLCAESGVDLRVANVPWRGYVYGSDGSPRTLSSPTSERLSTVCAELGLPYLDLTDALCASARELHDAGSPERLYYLRDGHWTPAGHAAAAEALFTAWLSGLAREWPR
jgi:lysophospholipase L1-like esterase